MNSTRISITNYLQEEVNKASLYIYPIIICLTLVTNILNICVLCRRNLRISSCTQYFLAFSLASILYTLEIPIMMFLRIRFGFAITGSSIGCPLQTFLIFILPIFISITLILASIDRFFASSSSIRIRNMTQIRFAQRNIIINVLLNILYHIPFLFIYYFENKTNQCLTHSSTIAVIYLSIRIIIYYIMIPLIMIIFGLLTIHNIQSQTRRIIPILMNAQQQYARRRRIEGQLARVLILQISAYLIFSIPAGVTYTIITFIPSMNTIFMVQLRIIFSLWQQSIYFFSFFLYILSSNAYRQQLKYLFKFDYLQDRLSYYATQLFGRFITNDNQN